MISDDIKQKRLKQLQNDAIAKGGILLSADYVDVKTKYLFECSEKHQFELTARKLRGGEWCRICNHVENTDYAKRLLDEVTERGGKLLSPYQRAMSKVLVICENGHEFSIKPMMVHYGHWCRLCQMSGPESVIEAYLILKNISHKREYSIPGFVNKFNQPYSFDFAIFNNNKLAGLIEFYGLQHSRAMTYRKDGNRTPEEKLQQIQASDLIKQEYCAAAGIPLYVIDYHDIKRWKWKNPANKDYKNDLEKLVQEKLDRMMTPAKILYT